MNKEDLNKFKEYDIVLVQWVDAVSEERWISKHEVNLCSGDQLIASCGYFLEHDGKMIAVASSISESDLRCMIMYIPVAMIDNIVMLKEYDEASGTDDRILTSA